MRFSIEQNKEMSTVRLVSEEDFSAGYSMTHNFTDYTHELMETLECYELMEGVWEISGDTVELRNSLINEGFKEF